MRIDVNPMVLGFALAASLLTGILFGLAPAVAAARTDLQPLLKEGARGSSSRGSRLRGALVVAEVALSVLLLVGAALMMQTFLRLQRIEPGFAPERILVARVTKFQPGRRAERSVALSGFHEQVLTRLRALPGVISAGGANGLPYMGTQAERGKTDLFVRGQTAEETRYTAALAGQDVSPGYLEAMRIPLLRGRYFDQRDTTSSPMVVIVNERGANTLWPGRDPIGQQVLWGMASADNPYCTVVGVVGNIHHHSGEEDSGVELYYPYSQYPVSSIFYVVRTRAAPETIAAGARDAIRAVDRNAAIVWMKPMEQIMDESLWQRRLWGTLFLVFAALALVLAAIGIYGVMSYLVSQRTREIGIRVALGAGRGTVISMVLRHGMTLVLVGVTAGTGAAFALARVIRGMLFGVSANDPVTFAAVPLFLAAVALAACYLPARRAASVDPLIALHQE
jgi:putative ABC transport system permease protein